MISLNIKKFLAIAIGMILLASACKSVVNSYNFKQNYKSVNEVLHHQDSVTVATFLKAHMHNGDVYVIKDKWELDAEEGAIIAESIHYDFQRTILNAGMDTIPIEGVAIFETNNPIKNRESEKIEQLTILTAIDAILGVLCVTIPKACFGSCPTFYLDDTDDFHFAEAEGFSNAIAPSLEYTDIDAMQTRYMDVKELTLTMKNEALETHCVKKANLLAYPVDEGERVHHSIADQFYLSNETYVPNAATGPEGDFLSTILTKDKNERFSLSDGDNLSSKEGLIIDFDNIPTESELGLSISFRQSMMTTYFIYSAMGYMGDEVGDMFAHLERNKEAGEKLNDGIKTELGEIDIYVWDEANAKWVFENGFYETGPIAINKEIIKLNSSAHNGQLKIKIILNKGLWRIDQISLVNVIKEVQPMELEAHEVVKNSKIDNEIMKDLISDENYVISMPGDEFTFQYNFPEDGKTYELFLKSRGYYLEWMRASWIKDKDLAKLWQMVEHPVRYLKSEAHHYKQYEAEMEEQFWNSKIDTDNFSYETE